jgi:hypothetical protein
MNRRFDSPSEQDLDEVRYDVKLCRQRPLRVKNSPWRVLERCPAPDEQTSARARANGTKLGRRRVDPTVEAQILELKASGDGILKIGRKLGIGTSVVQRVFKQEARPS